MQSEEAGGLRSNGERSVKTESEPSEGIYSGRATQSHVPPSCSGTLWTAIIGAGCQGETADTETVTPVRSPVVSDTDTGPPPAVTVTDAAVMPGVVVPGTDSSGPASDGQFLVRSASSCSVSPPARCSTGSATGWNVRPETFRTAVSRWRMRPTVHRASEPQVATLPNG